MKNCTVKVSVYLVGPSIHVSALTNFKGTHIVVNVLKEVEKDKIMELIDRISELISNIDIPTI